MEFTPEMLASMEGMPLYLDQRPSELEDPARELAPNHWQPACGTTSKLTRCLEAIRDISSAFAPIMATTQPDSDKRLVKQLVPPIYNLATSIRDLYNDVQSNHWPRLEKKKQEKLAKRFKQFGDVVPTKTGALKAARDKIGAHLDKDLFTWEYRQFWDSFGIANILFWIRGCMRMLEPLIHPDIYRWSRSSGYSNVWNLMSADGSEVSILMEDGEPTKFIRIQLTTSPKAAIVREARELVSNCLSLADRLGILVECAEDSEE